MYVVREHDTITAIARRLNASWQELAAVNGIAAPYTISPRQELKVPGLVVIDVPPFPAAGAFVIGRCQPAVLDLDECLIAGG
ncbi:LysM domain-containing protein [Actinacidiphila glaucinigra]|uniref:LysM peptidoglycan-binding domain-containing protein n=1 Tax=Actinacidiphila glaucinigra TaxID=235986 RepID=UPI00339FAF14